MLNFNCVHFMELLFNRYFFFAMTISDFHRCVNFSLGDVFEIAVNVQVVFSRSFIKAVIVKTCCSCQVVRSKVNKRNP